MPRSNMWPALAKAQLLVGNIEDVSDVFCSLPFICKCSDHVF